jgi:cytochrome c-type biogenesis protein
VEQFLTSLNRAVEGPPLLALLAALAWGVLSIVLSPCHLASIPLIVGFVSGQGPTTTRRAFGLSALFALGILATIALIGAITAAAGRIMGDLGGWANYAVAVIFFAVGLHLMGVIPMPWSGPGSVRVQRKGLLAALTLGLLFGVALGPCTFAFMAPMLAVAFKVAAAQPIYAVLLLALFGLGHCAVIAGAGTCTEIVQRYLDWSGRSRLGPILRSACGVLVLLGGIWLVYTAP